MQNYKKLALAVALAIPAAAQADVTIYGFLSGGIESAKATGAAPTTEYKRTTRVVDNNSRIGFKGNEDLGGGLKAIWQVESSLRNFEQGGTNAKGETATLGTRNTFIGLQGNSWGTVLLGNYDSAYKRLSDVGLNVLTNTTADTHGSSSIYSRREARLTNSVHYTSPVFAGFQAGLSYGADEDSTKKSDRWSLGLGYAIAGLTLGAGYDFEGDKISATINDRKAYKLAASYKFETGTFIGAGWERVKTDNVTAKDTTQDDWLVAAGQQLGAFNIKAGYGKLGKLKNGTENAAKAKQWLVGATYDLSKRTQAYAYGTKITNNSGAAVNFAVNPIFSPGTTALAAGNDPSAFGIGLKHAF